MARFAEAVYVINLDGPNVVHDASDTGDGSWWLGRSGDGTWVLRYNREGTGGAEVLLGDAQIQRVRVLLRCLPAPGAYPSGGCDGLHCRMVVSAGATIERYFWWAGDQGRSPELAPLGELSALLETWSGGGAP